MKCEILVRVLHLTIAQQIYVEFAIGLLFEIKVAFMNGNKI